MSEPFRRSIISSLSDDGRHRLVRVWPILQRGLKARSQLPLRDLVEGCWVALGGPVGLPENVITDISLVFALIEELDQGGDLTDLEQLVRRLQQLYSPPDSRTSGKLQIMTIHKAKGLQFDTVILPGLGKKTRTSDAPLLRWLEHPEHGLLLAPVSARGSQEKDLVYQLVAHLEACKDDFENARLLYVATTRAIRHLHLLGHAGRRPPAHGAPCQLPYVTALEADPRADRMPLGRFGCRSESADRHEPDEGNQHQRQIGGDRGEEQARYTDGQERDDKCDGNRVRDRSVPAPAICPIRFEEFGVAIHVFGDQEADEGDDGKEEIEEQPGATEAFTALESIRRAAVEVRRPGNDGDYCDPGDVQPEDGGVVPAHVVHDAVVLEPAVGHDRESEEKDQDRSRVRGDDLPDGFVGSGSFDVDER